MGQLAELSDGQDPITSQIVLTLGTASWDQDPANTAEYCVIVIPLTQETGPAAWAGQLQRIWWAVDYTEVEAAFSSCGAPGYELDPLVWGDDIVEIFVGYYSTDWGVGLGEPTPLIVSEIEPAFIKAGLNNHLLGARLAVPAFLSIDSADGIEDVWAIGYEVDPVTLELVFDGDGFLVPLEKTEVYPFP